MCHAGVRVVKFVLFIKLHQIPPPLSLCFSLQPIYWFDSTLISDTYSQETIVNNIVCYVQYCSLLKYYVINNIRQNRLNKFCLQLHLYVEILNITLDWRHTHTHTHVTFI